MDHAAACLLTHGGFLRDGKTKKNDDWSVKMRCEGGKKSAPVFMSASLF